ncbi:unnamed protein product, partial [Iphiclides podalirius]
MSDVSAPGINAPALQNPRVARPTVTRTNLNPLSRAVAAFKRDLHCAQLASTNARCLCAVLMPDITRESAESMARSAAEALDEIIAELMPRCLKRFKR